MSRYTENIHLLSAPEHSGIRGNEEGQDVPETGNSHQIPTCSLTFTSFLCSYVGAMFWPVDCGQT